MPDVIVVVAMRHSSRRLAVSIPGKVSRTARAFRDRRAAWSTEPTRTARSTGPRRRCGDGQAEGRLAGKPQQVAGAPAVGGAEPPHRPAGARFRLKQAGGEDTFRRPRASHRRDIDEPRPLGRVAGEQVVGMPAQRLVGPQVARDAGDAAASRAPDVRVPAALEVTTPRAPTASVSRRGTWAATM